LVALANSWLNPTPSSELHSMPLILQKTASTALRYQELLDSRSLGKTGIANVVLDMVQIPGGSFLMASPNNEPLRSNTESPQHEVTVSPYFIGQFPITQLQWSAVAALPKVLQDLESDPSSFKGNSRPVEQVSWHDATEFCQRLAQYTGRPYRLPTEAEWEYACRAGTTTLFHFGNTITSEVANYNWDEIYNRGESKKVKDFEGTTPVGQFGVANPFGLFDMHGNVWEWCQDHWYDSYQNAPNDGSAWIDPEAKEDASRVLRGGSWIDIPRHCRSATRNWDVAGFRYYYYGFRVVCSAPRT
jgi:formylglycine-generating enzyme required for sulfatase activity